MTKRQRAQLIIIIILLILLIIATAGYVNYRSTRKFGLGLELGESEAVPMPEFLYSFGGTGSDPLTRPLGVLVDGERCYVTDARRGVVDVFTLPGTKVSSFGKGNLLVPLYIEKHPKTGEFWVSDRRLRSIVVFSATGKYIRDFKPNLPKDQKAPFETKGFEWAPVAFDFGADGTLYAIDILNGHRLLIFGPDGKFKKSVGDVGLVADAGEDPGAFQFPNGLEVLDKEVWIADSNNRRLKVYDLNGDFKRIVPTEGLPRGFAFLPKKNEKQWLVVVDTLAHDATLWEAPTGNKLLTFGAQGVLDGQFNYPNDASTDARRRMFIADTANARIQVWGWPEEAAPVPGPRTPVEWGACASPLILFPIFIWRRKKKFFATHDFVDMAVETENVPLLPHSRRAWWLTHEDYEDFQEVEIDDVKFKDLFEGVDHSDADTKALSERFEITYERAMFLAIAQRADVFCTEDAEFRRIAKVLEIDVVDWDEFVERFKDGKHERRTRGEQRS